MMTPEPSRLKAVSKSSSYSQHPPTPCHPNFILLLPCQHHFYPRHPRPTVIHILSHRAPFSFTSSPGQSSFSSLLASSFAAKPMRLPPRPGSPSSSQRETEAAPERTRRRRRRAMGKRMSRAWRSYSVVKVSQTIPRMTQEP